MAQYKTTSCGYQVVFNGPDTVEDYDQKAGKVGTCLEDAVENIIYRGTLPKFQSALADAMTKAYGIAREVDEVATARAQKNVKEGGTAKPVMERFKAFNLRVRGKITEGLSEAEANAKLAELQALASDVAESITVDPAPSARASAVNKGDLAKADEILSRSPDNIEAVVTKMLDVVDFDVERDDAGLPDRDSLAKLIGAYTGALLAI